MQQSSTLEAGGQQRPTFPQVPSTLIPSPRGVKRRASSPPMGSSIDGVHRAMYGRYAVEPGLSLKSFKELADSISERQRGDIIVGLLEFEHERLCFRLRNLKIEYKAIEAVGSAAPGSRHYGTATPAEDRDCMDELKEDSDDLRRRQALWRGNVEEARRRSLDNRIDWLAKAVELDQMVEEVEEHRELCGASVSNREAGDVKTLLGPENAAIRGRLVDRTPTTDHSMTSTPSPAGRAHVGCPVLTYRQPAPSPESDGRNSAALTDGGSSDVEDALVSKRPALRTGLETTYRSPTPIDPSRGVQGGRTQTRRRLRSPNRDSDMENAFNSLIEALEGANRGRPPPGLRDIRESLIEYIKTGSDWYVFRIEGEQDNEVSGLNQMMDAL